MIIGFPHFNPLVNRHTVAGWIASHINCHPLCQSFVSEMGHLGRKSTKNGSHEWNIFQLSSLAFTLRAHHPSGEPMLENEQFRNDLISVEPTPSNTRLNQLNSKTNSGQFIDHMLLTTHYVHYSLSRKLVARPLKHY